MITEPLSLFAEACGLTPGFCLLAQREDRPSGPEPRPFERPFLLIGRHPELDLLLSDPQVSRRHAYVQLIEGHPFLVDLKSRSGIHWPDGRRPFGWLEVNQAARMGPFHVSCDAPDSPGCSVPFYNPLTMRSKSRAPHLPATTLDFFQDRIFLKTWQLTRVLTLLGKSPQCRACLHDSRLSSIHCSLLRTPLGTWAIDLRGKGGTFINGKPITWAKLEDGDELQLGSFAIRVHHAKELLPSQLHANDEVRSDTSPAGASSSGSGSFKSSSRSEIACAGAQSQPDQVTAVDEFVHLLQQSRLLNNAQWTELTSELAAQPQQLRALARHLMEREWLTAFQINQIILRQADRLILGPYTLLERLGKGGMGQVYKAHHRFMNRLVALKLIQRKLLDSPASIRRFRQEIELAAQLSHPHVAFAYDAGVVAGTPYLAMEYVEGISLGQLVEQDGPLGLEQACACIFQAALGLQHGFERGLVHRDIKPSNLLLKSAENAIKIVDWGLARLNDPSPDRRRLTRFGKAIGTSGFIAPEQILDSSRADIRSDLYSLGCTFYFLLSGRLPFPLERKLSELSLMPRQEPEPLEVCCTDQNEEIFGVVRKLMAPLAPDRYQTPAELASDLLDKFTPLQRFGPNYCQAWSQ
jgi:pSer/pThr/pTyr-binding forkhead associated (FHA) protein/tRNA A-37 threonylcarbamoyl transferase component Bud32